jgi:hypothetical protein
VVKVNIELLNPWHCIGWLLKMWTANPTALFINPVCLDVHVRIYGPADYYGNA